MPTYCDQVAVQQLYEFRDHYFEHNSTDKASLKNQETQEKLKETLNILDYVQGKDNLFYICVVPENFPPPPPSPLMEVILVWTPTYLEIPV